MADTKYLNHTFNLGAPGHVSPGAAQPPRISEAIFKANAGQDPRFQTQTEKDKASGTFKGDFTADFDGALTGVLLHIQERLDKRMGEAWSSPWGYGGQPEPDPDEIWARLFSELVVFAGYSGIAWGYDTRKTEKSLIGAYEMSFLGRSTDADDPVFPITMACQHLSTLCVLSRGLAVSDLSNGTSTFGLTAGNNGGLPMYSNGNATYQVTASGASTETGGWRDLQNLITNHALSPASFFGFNPLGPAAGSQPDGSHIGSVLRVFASPPSFAFQGIDTGPLGGQGGDITTMDHNLVRGTLTILPNTLVGIGLLPAKKPGTDVLDRLRKTRPLGLARLVLFDSSNNVRFMSPLLPTYHADVGYPISKLVWSLRGLPTDDVLGLWVVYTTQDAATEALLDKNARDSPLATTLTNIVVHRTVYVKKGNETIKTDVAVAIEYGSTAPSRYTTMSHTLKSDANHGVTLHRFKQYTHDGAQVVGWFTSDGNPVGTTPPMLNSLMLGKQKLSTVLRTTPGAVSQVWKAPGTGDPEDATPLVGSLEYFGAGSAPLAAAPAAPAPVAPAPQAQPAEPAP